jgi:hypothetical protein
MTTAAPHSNSNSFDLDVSQAQTQMDQLERREWSRWGISLFVMLALTFTLFALSWSVRGHGLTWQQQEQLGIALRSLAGLVLLFDVFVVYQQVLISKLRRELAMQLRVVTTLETLRKADDEDLSLQTDRRQLRRVGIDRRVRLTSVYKGKPICVEGRIRDISENGIGAVFPCSLSIDEQVTLEFSLENDQQDSVSAVVRHRRGFLYGFDFIYVEPSLQKTIAHVMEPTAVRVG